MSDHLAAAFPRLATHVPKSSLANLPTPVSQASLPAGAGARLISIKHDSLSGDLYGGNKVRKLEYLLCRANEREALRVATFGTAGSNHALATALYSHALGVECTCLLSHQARTPFVASVLNTHLQVGTELVPFGGERAARVRIMRRALQHRGVFLIPPGGSNWLGALGFVNAGLEIADQVRRGELPAPDRVYVANGTMATAAGLALGLALAELPTEVHAIRVTHEFVSNRRAMSRLIDKTATVMRRLDDDVPANLRDRVRLMFRDEYFGDGYARSNAATDGAVRIAREALDLELETTYTGKAMAALIDDAQRRSTAGLELLFWNTYNARPLATGAQKPPAASALPDAFLRYFD